MEPVLIFEPPNRLQSLPKSYPQNVDALQQSEQTSSSAAAISSSSQYRKSLSEAVAELEEWKLRQKRKFQQGPIV